VSQTITFFKLKIAHCIVESAKARQQVYEIFASVNTGTERRYCEITTTFKLRDSL
jgi:hypothetical protein